MQNQDLYQLFVDELSDMYSSENQIIESLPGLIKIANLPALREAMTQHLEETKNQVTRIEEICSMLDITPEDMTCKAMEGLLNEAEDIVRNKTKSSLLDAAIISALQKVEHYEIASYGTLRSFAKFLDFDSDIIDLLQDSLDEEGAADKKLTKIAEGTLFSSGINKEAAGMGRKNRK